MLLLYQTFRLFLVTFLKYPTAFFNLQNGGISVANEEKARVPEHEDISIIDMKLPEILLGIATLGTISALGYMFYSYVRIKTETAKYEALAKAAGTIAREVAMFMIEPVSAPSSGNGAPAKKKTPRVRKVT